MAEVDVVMAPAADAQQKRSFADNITNKNTTTSSRKTERAALARSAALGPCAAGGAYAYLRASAKIPRPYCLSVQPGS